MVPNCHERSSRENLIIIFEDNDVEMLPIWMETILNVSAREKYFNFDFVYCTVYYYAALVE